MIDAVVVPADTPKEEIQRLEAERKKERERKEKLEVEQRIQSLESEYREDKEERYQEGIDLMKWSAMVCFIGSFCFAFDILLNKDTSPKTVVF